MTGREGRHRAVRQVGVLVAVAVLCGCGAARNGPAGKLVADTAARMPVVPGYARLRLSFEPNVGQSDGRVRFLARAAGSTLLLTAHEAVLAVGGGHAAAQRVLRLQFPGAGDPALGALDPLPGKVNYLVGSDRSRWRTGVPTFGQVRYAHLWPGIDATFYGERSRLEYDLRVGPGADSRRIALRFAGARRERLDSRGGLVLTLAGGTHVRELAPVAYQLADGRRRAVASRFVLTAGITRIALGGYDHHRPLTIDPALVYSTYLGGSALDEGSGIAADSAGNAYVTGVTTSTDFPVQNPAQAANGGGADAFVSKLNAAGNGLIYSTYLGGSGNDVAHAIAVDAAGDAYITGVTTSTNYPTKNALQPTNHGGEDAFVTQLNAAGALVYSTYLGGSSNDNGHGIAVDAAGNAYITGSTTSTNFPTRNPEQPSCGDPGCTFGDAFVTKLDGAGALSYSTYLGGNGVDIGDAVAVDAAGETYITGATLSTSFPTRNPLQATNAGSIDAFVTKLNAAGSALVYSSYLGGSGADGASAIAVDAAGGAYVAGLTLSTNFPTQNPEQPSCGEPTCSQGDAFVTKLNPTGSALVYSTYLGGSGTDQGQGIAVDPAGDAYVTGSTKSTNFPTVDPEQPSCGDPGCSQGDAFVTKLSPAGSALAYSTYLGGSGQDVGFGIAVDSAGGAYVTGFTGSGADFPLHNPLQPTYGGGVTDAFVTKLAGPDVTPPSSAASVPVCQGPVTVTVTDDPGGSGPAAANFRLDGGAVQTIATAGNPGTAEIPIPEGNHSLEYWGVDAAGNQEFPHHVAGVQVDTTPPALSITSDQRFSAYEIGDRASVTITASDAISGLVADPSQAHKKIPTRRSGRFTATISATDRCGNSTSATFAYTVIANPVFARSVDLEPRAGRVTLRVAGARRRGRSRFVALVGARRVPLGTIVDSSAGEVRVTTATARRRQLQSGVFQGGRFIVLQSRAGHGLAELRLIDTAGSRTCKRASARATRAVSARPRGLLRANAKGRFRTSGRYAWATTRRTVAVWSIADRCDGTLVRVTHGSVTVRDFHTGRQEVIRAGHRYLAPAG